MTAEPGSDHQLTFARAYAGAAHSDQALADLEGLLDGSLDVDGLAVDTDLRWTLLSGAGQERPRRRRRGSTRSWPATTRSPARSTPPRPARCARPPRPRPRRGSRRWSATTSPTRPSAASCWPSRPTARTRCSRRTSRSTSRPPTRVGGEGHPARLDRAGVHLPEAAGQPGAPRPRRRLAGELTGQPGRQALRPRGPRRRRPRPPRPGQGRASRLWEVVDRRGTHERPEPRTAGRLAAVGGELGADPAAVDSSLR